MELSVFKCLFVVVTIVIYWIHSVSWCVSTRTHSFSLRQHSGTQSHPMFAKFIKSDDDRSPKKSHFKREKLKKNVIFLWFGFVECHGCINIIITELLTILFCLPSHVHSLCSVVQARLCLMEVPSHCRQFGPRFLILSSGKIWHIVVFAGILFASERREPATAIYVLILFYKYWALNGV